MPLEKVCECGIIIDYSQSRCNKCREKYSKRNKQRHRQYKDSRTDKQEQLFYSSKEWISTSNYIKAKYKNICLYSYYVLNEIVYCDCTHHIVELKDEWEQRLRHENLIPLSDAAHNIIHNQYRKGNASKEATQKLLRELKQRWETEFS